jgi:prophage regulatory protein
VTLSNEFAFDTPYFLEIIMAIQIISTDKGSAITEACHAKDKTFANSIMSTTLASTKTLALQIKNRASHEATLVSKESISQSTDHESRFSKSRRNVSLIMQSSLPTEGFVRLKQILAPVGPIPVGKSTWWAGVKTGRFPAPSKCFGKGITVWNVQQIRELIADVEI